MGTFLLIQNKFGSVIHWVEYYYFLKERKKEKSQSFDSTAIIKPSDEN